MMNSYRIIQRFYVIRIRRGHSMRRFRPRFTLRFIMISIAVVTVLTYCAGLPIWRYYRLPANTRAVLSAVRSPVRLPSSGTMPLMTLLKNIKTKSPGIPIHVDPIGIADAKTEIDAMVTVSGDKLMVKAHLEHALKPLGLGFFVKDGLLLITSKKNAELELITFPSSAARP